VKAGTSQSPHLVPIHHLAGHAGHELCKVLPAIHTLTGCNYTSKFGTKAAAVKAGAVKYLENFGSNPVESDIESVVAKAEEYLVQVMKDSDCKTMDELFTCTITAKANNNFLPPVLQVGATSYDLCLLLTRLSQFSHLIALT